MLKLTEKGEGKELFVYLFLKYAKFNREIDVIFLSKNFIFT